MKALELKAQSGDHKAQYKLGEIYAVGNKEIEKNVNKSLYWYQQSAKNGNEAAQYILGNF